MSCGVGVGPDVFRGPLGERADLADRLPVGRVKSSISLQGRAAFGLLAAQAGEPEPVVLERGEERLDLAHAAAAAGIGLVEDAELRLLLGDGELGQQVDEVEVPVGGHAVAVVVDLGEVVAGVEEDDGDVGQMSGGPCGARPCPRPGSCW